MTPLYRVVVVIALVVLAGCSLTLDVGSTSSPTQSPTPAVEQQTPNSTPTPNETSRFPPGVNETGIPNVSALLDAHTAALNRTGYVANGSGNTTILHSGFLVNVSRSGRVVVANGSQRYYEVRRTHAGPLDRIEQRYSNGSVEFVRLIEDGDKTFRRRGPQSPEKLARVGHLDSFLRGGNFSVVEVREDEEPTTIILRANRSDNETAVLSGLPGDAETVLSYNATALVDSAGRVRWLTATVEFVIGGTNRTHSIEFNLTRIGVLNVSQPDWVDEMTDNGSDSAGSVVDRPDRTDRHLRQLVVIVDTGGSPSIVGQRHTGRIEWSSPAVSPLSPALQRARYRR